MKLKKEFVDFVKKNYWIKKLLTKESGVSKQTVISATKWNKIWFSSAEKLNNWLNKIRNEQVAIFEMFDAS